MTVKLQGITTIVSVSLAFLLLVVSPAPSRAQAINPVCPEGYELCGGTKCVNPEHGGLLYCDESGGCQVNATSTLIGEDDGVMTPESVMESSCLDPTNKCGGEDDVIYCDTSLGQECQGGNVCAVPTPAPTIAARVRCDDLPCGRSDDTSKGCILFQNADQNDYCIDMVEFCALPDIGATMCSEDWNADRTHVWNGDWWGGGAACVAAGLIDGCPETSTEGSGGIRFTAEGSLVCLSLLTVTTATTMMMLSMV